MNFRVLNFWKISACLWTLLFTFTFNAHAATPTPQLIWEAWYTVTIQEKVPYGYYQDRVELRDNRIHFQNHYTKLEEGTLHKEHLGAFAKNDPALTPLFFNFHSTYRLTETKIDGTVKDGALLTVKIQKGETELPLVKKQIPKKIIFSIFFPLWLHKKIPDLKAGKTLAFSTLLEDNLEAQFQTIGGTVRLDKPDTFATQTQTHRFTVNYRNQRSTWYVETSGMPIKISIPAQGIIVQKVSQTVAENYLKEK